MWKVWCEWDYGQDSSVFTLESKARAFIDEIAKAYDTECATPEFGSGQALLDAGLAGITKVCVDPQSV